MIFHGASMSSGHKCSLALSAANLSLRSECYTPATILICGSPADRFEIVALTLKA
jgi:hypothetical protein